MDNARIHHSKIVKKYIGTTKHKILFNVPYMPEYNPIEKFFSEIKFYIRSKKNNHKKTCLINNINKFFNYVNKKICVSRFSDRQAKKLCFLGKNIFKCLLIFKKNIW